jgi:membrane fusion protein, multidrug efflux system
MRKRLMKYKKQIDYLKFIIAITITTCLLISCSGKSKDTGAGSTDQKKIPVPVTVAKADAKDVPIELKTNGNTEALSSVFVTAQVAAQLMEVHFTEGQDVKKGDLLFTLDSRSYETMLKEAEAKLANDSAQLTNAIKEVERYGSVVDKGGVSKENHDRITTNAEILKAVVDADKAIVQRAKLNLDYCFIRSPIDGRTGELKVHVGNLIKDNDNANPMVIIRQIKPIYVTFAIPEQYLIELKTSLSKGKLKVFATVPVDGYQTYEGVLTLVDNAVDQTTGTIKLKATFKNETSILWPGQFVNVVLVLGTRENAIVVPSQAVQSGQKGQYVFVVKSDMTVEYRIVTAGKLINSEIVIEKGLTKGETVVTDGQLRLADKSLINIVDNDNASSEGSPQ